jgi:outer membrane protein TolC
LAVERNPDMDVARARIAASEQDLVAARSAYRPRVGVDLGYLKGDAPSAYLFKTIDARTLPPRVNFNQPPGFQSVTAGVGVRYTLWDGGRRRLDRQRAAQGRKATDEGSDQVANHLIVSVVWAYFDLLAARESVGVAEASVRTVDAQIKDARVRFEGGGILRSDLLALEVRKAQAQEGLIQARGGVELAQAALVRLLDLDPSTELELSGEEWQPVGLPDKYPQGLEVAVRLRPELRGLGYQKAAAQAGVSRAQAEKHPRMELVGRYWLNDNGFDLETGRDNWTVGAALRWDLLDGGQREAMRKKAASQLEQVQAQERALLRGIELEVRKAYVDWKVSQASFEVARANVERSEEGLRLVEQQFEGGAVAVTRYLQAEEDRTRARLGEIRARYAVKKAKATVGSSLGLCVSNLIKGEKE